MSLYLFNELLLTMMASSWKKAADIIVKTTLADPQVQAAATAESQKLQSLPLSTLEVDDNRPPQVTYEPQQPIATSTPRATSTESPEISTEAYHQILPGMSAQLYPTLVADSSLDTHALDNQGDDDEVDTIPYAPGDSEDEQFNTAVDDTSEDPMIVMGKPLTTAFVSANIHIPTEKVGCLQVTNQLKEFLNHFPPESKEKASEQIYEILQGLEAYLRDNPQQHIHCMLPDSEYVSLIMYATEIEIDLCNFPAIWAVLSILLDTQSNTLQYVKSLQQVVNNYYDKCPTDVMSRLEHQISDITKAMYDSINNDNFDSISGDTDRVSGVVDNDYDTNDYDKDEHVMPYDKDEYAMPYDKDEYAMPYDKDEYAMPYDKDEYAMPCDKDEYAMPYDKDECVMPYDKDTEEVPYD